MFHVGVGKDYTTLSLAAAYGIMFLNFGGPNPASNITISNCKIQGTPVNSSVVGIFPVFFSSNNIQITNNMIGSYNDQEHEGDQK